VLRPTRRPRIPMAATDPVCGMNVERTGPRTEHGGVTVWFCSDGCRREFLSDPDRFG